MSFRDSYFINRTICAVLDEMRECYKTRNFASLMGLIEEAQSMANRMESGLEDKADLKAMHEEWNDLRKKLKKLRKEVKTEEEKIEKLKPNE